MNSKAPPRRSRLGSLAPILVFDIIGPLALYYGLTIGGASAVPALVLSGVLPAFGIALMTLKRHRVDAVGVVVLVGIVVSTIASLVSGSARLALLDGAAPIAVFGIVCLASLWTSRPLILRFAMEMMGPDTPRGQEFAARWRYPSFRHTFRVITSVWGIVFLAEAGAQAIIIDTASTTTAKTASNVMPVAVIAVLMCWNMAYGMRAQGKAYQAMAKEDAGGPPEVWS